MASRTPPQEHFNRGFGKPGWIYVVRNDLLREDIYKVGYTLRSPDVRANELNTEQRGGTSRIGFFSLVFAAAVLNAQGAEAALFRRLQPVRESSGKEFVNAPIELIIGEMLHIQKVDNEASVAFKACPTCGTVIKFCPHPSVRHICTLCKSAFRSTATGEVIAGAGNLRFGKTFVLPTEKFSASARSPLANAFLGLRNAVRQYCSQQIGAKAFLIEVEHWSSMEPPLDRSPPEPRAKPTRMASKPKRKERLQDGYRECESCLAVYRPDIENCPECGQS